MPLPLLLAAPAIAKGLLGAYQSFQRVAPQNTITEAEREQLGLSRQQAASQLPGMAAYQGRLAQAQAAATQQARLGAGSASDFLAAAGAADRTRANGEAQLTNQYGAYRDNATRQLSAALGAYGAHQARDVERTNSANAQLKGAAIQNISGALSDGASIAAYGAMDKTPAGAVDSLTPSQAAFDPLAPTEPAYPTRIDYRNPYGFYSRRPTTAGYGY